MPKSSVSRREFMKGAAVVGGGALLAGCAPEAVAESAPMTAMTAEEILTPLGLMPGSPDHPKDWTTALPDPPEGMPLSPPVTSFTRTDADTRFQGNDGIYDNISLRYRKALYGIDYEIPWTYVRGEERDQKMNLALAADEVPDLMPGIPLLMFQDMVAGRPGGRHYRCLRSDRAIESGEVGEQTIFGRAPGAQRPIVFHGDPKRVHELARINGASETPAMSGGSPCENSWFQIERT